MEHILLLQNRWQKLTKTEHCLLSAKQLLNHKMLTKSGVWGKIPDKAWLQSCSCFFTKITCRIPAVLTLVRGGRRERCSGLSVPVSGLHWAEAPWWWARLCALCTEWFSAAFPRCPHWKAPTSASSPSPRCRCAAATEGVTSGQAKKKGDRRHQTKVRLLAPYLYLEKYKQTTRFFI